MGLMGVGTNRPEVSKNQKERPWGYKIIKSFCRNGREYKLHATKGWRSLSIKKGSKE